VVVMNVIQNVVVMNVIQNVVVMLMIKVTSRFKGMGEGVEFVTKLSRITVGMSGLCIILRCICILLRNPSVTHLKHTDVSEYCLL
jgi:Kef-type K+ transport system membrane component KefB